MRKTVLFTTAAKDVTEDCLQEVAGAQVRLCKIGYTPPFETFEGIKRIQLAYHQALRRREGEVSLAIDISEWLGHEWEEYFLTLVKFAADHMGMCPFFVLTSVVRDEYIEALRVIRRVMFCEHQPDEVFRHSVDMVEYLRRHGRMSEGTAAALAELLIYQAPQKSYTMMATVLEQLASIAPERPADEEDLRDLMAKEGSILAMIAENSQREGDRNGIQAEIF